MGNLDEIWTKLGAKLFGWGETFVVMLPNLAAAVILVLVAAWAARGVERGVRTILLKVTSNPPVSTLAGTVSRVAIVLLAVFVGLEVLNLDRAVTSLLAGVGVVGLALGFAFQDIAANFMSGFIMTIQQPFQVDDLIEVNGRLGRVRSIALRATTVETLDGLSVLVPNKEVFQNAIINYTKTPNRRIELSLGTAYADDMERVRTVVRAAARTAPLRDETREVEVFFTAFGDSSINLTVRFWLTAADQISWLTARSEAMIAIKKAFDDEGITIPFPIRTLDFGANAVGGQSLEPRRFGASVTESAETTRTAREE